MSLDKKLQGNLCKESRRRPIDNLTRDVLAAEAAGMSYGKYKGLQHEHAAPAKAPEPTKGKDKGTPARQYNLTCAICGAAFIAVRVTQKYCGDYCRNQAKNAKYRAKYHEKVIQEVESNAE